MAWLDWMTLFVRWFHVITGVAWIGASFYFVWLDNNLRTPPDWKKDRGIKGDLWAVHGGGFYEVAKYEYGPEKIPEHLHWFKWEAYSTWLSGIFLLSLIYYAGASAYLIDPAVMPMSGTTAVLLGIGFIAGGLAIYELACRSPLGQSPVAFALFFVLLLSVATYLATQWFSGRGAYIHVGAFIGTIMAGNVFFKIMPSQRLMVAAVTNKGAIDPKWGEEAKLRSVHNNYLTLPLIFIMISNHYPVTYQHPQNWLVLIVISVIAAWIRHYFNLKHVGKNQPLILVSGAIAMMGLAFWVSWPAATPSSVAAQSQAPQAHVTQAQVTELVQKHCVTCHAENPTDDIFTIAPLGLKLDTWQQVELNATKINHRVVVTKDMPFLNKTGMTDAERQTLGAWYLQQQNGK